MQEEAVVKEEVGGHHDVAPSKERLSGGVAKATYVIDSPEEQEQEEQEQEQEQEQVEEEQGLDLEIMEVVEAEF